MNDDPSDDDLQRLVPLVLLAAELGAHAEDLVVQLGDAVLVDHVGLRSVPVDVAKEVLAAHRAAVEAERQRDREYRAQMAQRPDPGAYVAALRRSQAATAPQFDGELPAGAALASMHAVDGHRDAQLDAAAERFDEMTTGRLNYHHITERH